MNPNHSETKFSIRINPNESEVGMIRNNFDWKFGLDQTELGLIPIDLDWKLGFGLVRILSDWCLGINRIKSDWFLTVFIKRDTKRFSDWFGMIRIESDTDIGMNRNSSDWLWIHLDSFFGLNQIRLNRFFTVFHQTSYKMFFGLVRNDSH